MFRRCAFNHFYKPYNRTADEGKNERGAEVAKGLVVADTHGQEILEGLLPTSM
jgi:hypothetical protein